MRFFEFIVICFISMSCNSNLKVKTSSPPPNAAQTDDGNTVGSNDPNVETKIVVSQVEDKAIISALQNNSSFFTITWPLVNPATKSVMMMSENGEVSYESPVSGSRGSQGIQGIKGDTGPQGPQGTKGEVGAVGPQGPIGPTGVPGPKGETGDTGPQGNIGIQGLQGIPGLDGSQGNQGIAGTNGVDGSQILISVGLPKVDFGAVNDFVIDSSNGNYYKKTVIGWGESLGNLTGPQGNIGVAGPQGAKGDTGDTGLQGIQGIQGVKGDTGLQGIQGVAGVQGAKGDTGDVGPIGPTGLPGAKGDTGPKGDTGLQGIQGIQGVKGDTGLTGATGDTGPKGDVGVQGIQGIQGLQGIQGPQGDQGIAGNTGLAGSKWFYNVGIPTVSDGVDGDYWINTTDYNVYTKVSGAWAVTPFMNMKGATGAQGSQGIQGIQGVKGDTGSTGAQGPQGNVGVAGPQGPQGNVGVASATLPMVLTTNVLSINQSSASAHGYLSSSDWTSFNGKQSSISSASSVSSGYLTSSDWVIFNNKQPLMSVATSSSNGYLSSSDWSVFNNKVSSPWSTSGNNLYRSTGNIGIGTTNPTSALHVTSVSGFSIYGSSSSAAQADSAVKGDNRSFGTGVFGNSDNGTGVLASSNGAGTTFVVQQWGSGYAATFAGGNVGIGSANPASTLDVNGPIYQSRLASSADVSQHMNTNAAHLGDEINLNPGILYYNDGYNSGGTDFGYTTSTSRFRTRLFTSANFDIALSFHTSNTLPTGQSSFTDALVIRGDSGNVGINTVSPLGLLDVSQKLVVKSGGNVGIGTTNPMAKLQINGQTASVVSSISTLSINFNTGNIQTDSVAPGTLVFNNMLDGASYTVVLTYASGGSYILSGSGVTTWKCQPLCGSNTVTVTSTKHTIVSVFKIGTIGYVSWIKDL